MRMRALVISILLTSLAAGAALAQSESEWTGRVRAGGIYLDETGDATTMPETFNIYDGFTLSSIYLKGHAGPRNTLLLDLSDINQDGRRGTLDFRQTGILHIRSRYDQSRWVYDPAGQVDAERHNWFSSVSVTPSKHLTVGGQYNLQTREGSRIGLTGGPVGWLGSAYDSKLHRYRLEARAQTGEGIGGTAAYDGVMQRDALDSRRERDGYVVSALMSVSGVMTDRLSHALRGAVGRNEIRDSGVGFDLKSVQYTGVYRATRALRFKYRFDGNRVDDEATSLRTDNYEHDIDGIVGYRFAQLSLGYGWEALDDDRYVTTTNHLRAALSMRHPRNRVSGRIAFAGADKDDKYDTTLMKDSEYARVDVRVDANPMTPLTVGARFADRTRDWNELGTSADGTMVSGYAAWQQLPGDGMIALTSAGVDYTWSDDQYDNPWADQHIVTHVITGRVGVTLFEDLDLKGSLTWLSANEDLDIDKSILSFGAGYRFPRGFLADVQYNVYNYDDYLLTSRLYTANVVWFNVGYEFSTGKAAE
jgi:hypothetical protein